MSHENPFEQPSQLSTPEQLPPRNDLEREQHLLVIRNIVKGLGFDETPEMKELSKTNPPEWASQARDLIDAQAVDAMDRMKLILGYELALAALYYEERDMDGYGAAIHDAIIKARRVDQRLADLIDTF